MKKTTKLYQIAPEASSLMECYIIRTAEDKIIVIDGGIDGFGKQNAPYLPSAIRAILGIGEHDSFEVEAWFLSHAHTDHIYELAKMLNAYSEEDGYRIRNLYFNFPPAEGGWVSRGGASDYSLAEVRALRDGMAHYAAVCGTADFSYDAVNGAVITPEAIGKGLTISVDECDFEVLQTWSADDAIVNSTSTVLRLRVGGKSVLFLGDAYTDTGDRLLATYGADYLRSDYVQLAHHGQHGCTKEFYLAIGAQDSVRLWPSPAWVWGVYKHGSIVCDETRSWFGLPPKPEDYFAGGYDRTGKDFVTGLYRHFPEAPTKVSDWTEAVLKEQLAAEF